MGAVEHECSVARLGVSARSNTWRYHLPQEVINLIRLLILKTLQLLIEKNRGRMCSKICQVVMSRNLNQNLILVGIQELKVLRLILVLLPVFFFRLRRLINVTHQHEEVVLVRR